MRGMCCASHTSPAPPARSCPQLNCHGLNGVTIDLAGTGGGSQKQAHALGSLSTKDGKFTATTECAQQAQQMFMVASSSAVGGELVILPVSRRVTLERVEEGPLPLPVALQLPDTSAAIARELQREREAASAPEAEPEQPSAKKAKVSKADKAVEKEATPGKEKKEKKKDRKGKEGKEKSHKEKSAKKEKKSKDREH
jgi:hypothetical protein